MTVDDGIGTSIAKKENIYSLKKIYKNLLGKTITEINIC